MMRHITANSESGTVRNGQEKLVTALEMLFNLLEEYAPQWYTHEHHDVATDALATAKKRRSPSSNRSRLKDTA